MIGARHEIARLQSDFYRNQLRRVLGWLMYSVLIMYILIAVICYLILIQPRQSHYGNTVDGKILPMPGAQIE
jgi:hypothetical protein